MLPGALRFYHHSLTESELLGEMADPLGQGKYESGISCNRELKTKLQTSIWQKDIAGAGEMTEQLEYLLFFQGTQVLLPACNCSSRGSNVFLWPLQAPTHIWCIYTHPCKYIFFLNLRNTGTYSCMAQKLYTHTYTRANMHTQRLRRYHLERVVKQVWFNVKMLKTGN